MSEKNTEKNSMSINYLHMNTWDRTVIMRAVVNNPPGLPIAPRLIGSSTSGCCEFSPGKIGLGLQIPIKVNSSWMVPCDGSIGFPINE